MKKKQTNKNKQKQNKTKQKQHKISKILVRSEKGKQTSFFFFLGPIKN